MFLAKKWGILIKKESESLIFTGLKIPRDYRTEWEDIDGNKGSLDWNNSGRA